MATVAMACSICRAAAHLRSPVDATMREAEAEAAAKAPTSMAATLGGDSAGVMKSISELGLEAANYNGPGQVVAAGAKDAIASLVSSPPEKARVIELKVAGAFHTSYMESAKAPVEELATAMTASDPGVRLWSNADGSEVRDGQGFLRSLVSQISNPVRWDLCMDALGGLDATVVELPPAGALAGLVKRGVADATAIALKSPADLDKVSNS